MTNQIEQVYGKNQYGIDMDQVHARAKEKADREIELCYPNKLSQDAQNHWHRIYWSIVKAMSEP